MRKDEPCFSISIAARLVEMHPQTIRHYERIGFLSPSRTDGKMRLFSRKDLERLTQIARFTRDMGINLAGVEVILKLLNELDRLREEMENHLVACQGAKKKKSSRRTFR